MKKLLVGLLISIMGAACAACTKGSSAQNVADRITESENMSEQLTTGAETSKEQSTETETQTESQGETETPFEYIEKYELNTVESLEDDGKDMSAAEALRSAMKGKHSVLELTYREQLYSLTEGWGWHEADEIKDMPDTGLARMNMRTYNRGMALSIMPINEARWESFVCVDLDRDGTKEVLAQGGPGGVALHYAGGEVYITVINDRRFPYDVYENGVCTQGEGSAWSLGHDRYYPAKGAMYIENLTYSEVGRFEDGHADFYKINNKEVTKEEYDSYIEELIGGLAPLEWHEFTEENIDKYVVD